MMCVREEKKKYGEEGSKEEKVLERKMARMRVSADLFSFAPFLTSRVQVFMMTTATGRTWLP